MECDPAVKFEIVRDADPEFNVTLPSWFDPSANVTVPVAPGTTVAFSISAAPKGDGLVEEVRLRLADALLIVW